MSNLILFAFKRTVFGKKVKALRKEGLIPAILYGRKTNPFPLSLNLKEFLDVYKSAGETDLINLKIKDGDKEETKTVLIQDISYDFINNDPVHIDFYEVEMDKPVTTYVPIEFIGESLAVKNGGVLIKSMEELEIEALPKDLPHRIQIDISPLDEFDKTLYVKDLKLPPGVKVLVKENTPVVTVTNPITEEELEAELGKVQTVEEIKTEKEEAKASKESEEMQETEENKETKTHE
ncbi:MAG: 50S ribosomal protein L25 [Minisyncoccia bacterium]